MPKFVSGSSGHIYAHDKLPQEEDEILAAISNQTDSGTIDPTNDVKKPSAVNKKGTKEKQKSSLDLFKEELRRLNEERAEQRNNLKQSSNSSQSQSKFSTCSNQSKPLAPVPLKPDPRCPTTLTLKVNLNPKDKESNNSGSFDTGDPATTNLYLGNLNPTVTENELCDIFGKFGSLASIKIMWPRTEEERARNRNSGFVAYMSRVDADRALKSLNGMEFKGYELKLGWGKAVPLPNNPVFIPKELLDFMRPPPESGLPFNAQMHKNDIERGYSAPKVFPKPPPIRPLETQNQADADLGTEAYNEFIEVLSRATVHVHVPQDRSVLDRIHKTIEYVIREGPVFETIIIARESTNPDYKFLYDYQSLEHIYYRWKLYSTLHGDDPYQWRTNEFRMFEGGPMWKPPPLNPYADGMPVELVEKLTGINKDILLSARPVFTSSKRIQISNEQSSHSSYLKFTGQFGEEKRKLLTETLSNLLPTKSSIGSAMLFAINHSDAAEEIINTIEQSLRSPDAPMRNKISQLYLISDILHNSSAAVTNASFYRTGFEPKLIEIFQSLRESMQTLDATGAQADRFKQKVLSVLSSWSYFQLYEKKFLVQLSNILLGINDTQEHLEEKIESAVIDEQLDGEQIDDEVLADCLNERGLSLRWYKTLELSDDELDGADCAGGDELSD